MTETFIAQETSPFPDGPDGASAREGAQAAADVLASDWAEGMRAPLRENALPKPPRRGAQLAPPPDDAGGESASLRTEQLDLNSLEGRPAEVAPEEAAPEVEAPEAWAGAEEDQLASVPPPAREGAKEEVLLLSDAELADDDDGAELGALGTHAPVLLESGPDAGTFAAQPSEEAPSAAGPLAGEAQGAAEAVALELSQALPELHPLERPPGAMGSSLDAKALYVEELQPAEVLDGDPWAAAFEETVRPAAAEASPWKADPGGEAIDWAPALAPAWDDGSSATEAVWGEPAKRPASSQWSTPPQGSTPASPAKSNAPASPASAHALAAATPEAAAVAAGPSAQTAWNDPVWDAQTVHAVSLPSLLARSPKQHEWGTPELEWPPASASPQPAQESPFAPLPPGASLSGEDEPGQADPALAEPALAEPELTELGPGELEPLPLDEHELLVPLEESSASNTSHPLALRGEHRVAVHTRAGQTLRGILRDADLSQAQLTLHPASGSAAPETLASSELKAIFFMLAPGEESRRGDGAHVAVTFVDGRSLEGERDGIDAREGFFVVPADAARTNTRRIYVARAALLQIVDG